MNNTFHFKKKKQNKKITHEINLSDTNGGMARMGILFSRLHKESPFGDIMINVTFSIFMINSPIKKGVQN